MEIEKSPAQWYTCTVSRIQKDIEVWANVEFKARSDKGAREVAAFLFPGKGYSIQHLARYDATALEKLK